MYAFAGRKTRLELPQDRSPFRREPRPCRDGDLDTARGLAAVRGIAVGVALGALSWVLLIGAASLILG